MGNVFTSGNGDNKAKAFEPIIEQCYDKYFSDNDRKKLADMDLASFYRLVCETVEEINKKQGNTQFLVPKLETLRNTYDNHHQGKGKMLSHAEFLKIMQEVILHTGFTGVGAKDILFYIFGVPATALLIKQRVFPGAIPNEYFIPGITSATVFLLAKLHKI